MTEQATQSSNALGRRSSPSSFFAPLQTLGLNLNRRREDSQPNDARALAPGGRSTPGRVEAAAGPRHGPLPASATGRLKESPARERDLEREPEPEPEPDPERVRGAIFRLAKEYEVPSSAPSAKEPLESQPAAFAEVARRVWAKVEPDATASSGSAGEASRADEEGTAVAAHVPHSRLASDPELERETQREMRQGSPQRSPQRDGQRSQQDTGQSSQQETGQASQSDPRFVARHDPQFDSRSDVWLQSRLDAPSGLASGLNESRALAHDAGNLLSALRLYGDLLCFSGVLHERHRHYAVDLKLLSLRGESLIGRLLLLADRVASEQRAGPPWGLSPVPAAALPNSFAGVQPGSASAPARDAAADRSTPRVLSRAASSFAADGRPAGRTDGDLRPRLDPSFNSSLDSGLDPGRDSGLDSGLDAIGATDEVIEAEEISSLAAILIRLQGLLGTLAHGALELDAGDQGSLAIAAPAEVVERILVNLVSNAAAAIRNGGAIRVRARIGASPEADFAAGDVGDAARRGETPLVVLTVDDSGCGISESELRAALRADAEPGRGAHRGGIPQDGPPGGPLPDALDWSPIIPQNEKDRHGSGRHGLGLLIVRDLVAATGGRLFIHSRQGTGTRMEIHWRAAQTTSLSPQRAGDVWNGDGGKRSLQHGNPQQGISQNGSPQSGSLQNGNPQNGNVQNGDVQNGGSANASRENVDWRTSGSRRREAQRDDPAWMVKGAVA